MGISGPYGGGQIHTVVTGRATDSVIIAPKPVTKRGFDKEVGLPNTQAPSSQAQHGVGVGTTLAKMDVPRASLSPVSQVSWTAMVGIMLFLTFTDSLLRYAHHHLRDWCRSGFLDSGQ